MNKEQENTTKLTIQIDPKLESGVYSNTATVMHSEAEVLMDFGMFVPGRQMIRVVSRVIMNPKHAKLLLRALHENVTKYEEKFGEIKVAGDGSGPLMQPPVIN